MEVQVEAVVVKGVVKEAAQMPVQPTLVEAVAVQRQREQVALVVLVL
jgi:hypothetical protein